MKKILAPIFISLIIFSACHSKDEAEYYFSDSDRDTLLTNVITLVSENAVYANEIRNVASIANDDSKRRAIAKQKADKILLINLWLLSVN